MVTSRGGGEGGGGGGVAGGGESVGSELHIAQALRHYKAGPRGRLRKAVHSMRDEEIAATEHHVLFAARAGTRFVTRAGLQ